MSLILDALKRAERERRGEAVPTHAEVPLVSAGAAAPRRGRDLVYAAVVAGGLALSAALLWDAFRARPAPQAEPQAPAPAPAQTQAPAQAPGVIVARPAPPPPATVVPGTEAVTSLDDLTDESMLEAPGTTPALVPKPSARPAKPAVQAGDRPEGIATRPAPPPATARAAEVPPAAPQPAPQRAQPAPEVRSEPAPAKPEPALTAPPKEAPPKEAPPEPAPAVAPAPVPTEIPPALTQPAPLRKFREMPPDYRADFPALKVEIHVYEKQAQRRFVMVNGRKYREGERLAEGPSLVEIVPDGMVLEYRGEKVLYTLGR